MDGEAVGAARSSGQGSSTPRPPTIAILGAGAAGLCMGIQLKKAGISSFTIFEKSERLGGTWFDNHYPGAGCDVPSHLYCFSFEPKVDWSRPYATQPEILDYLEHCVDAYGLDPFLRLGCGVSAARWDDADGAWHVTTDDGQVTTVDVLVSALGMFNDLVEPDLPGLDAFAGVVPPGRVEGRALEGVETEKFWHVGAVELSRRAHQDLRA